MEVFFKVFVWVCFIGLAVYTILYWIDSERMDKNVFLTRKIWYLVYVFGGLIYWTKYPTSIFVDWRNYIIVLVLFVCVDAFLFLNLYLRKAGTYEMERLTQTVTQNETLIEENLTVAKNMLDFLSDEGIIGYYDNKEDYILGLSQVLNAYATKEDMTVEFLPFTTETEKTQILELSNSKGAIRSKLARGETVYKENYALQTIQLFEEDYLLKISGERPITEMDCTLLWILVVMYEMSKPFENNGAEEVTQHESGTEDTRNEEKDANR